MIHETVARWKSELKKHHKIYRPVRKTQLNIFRKSFEINSSTSNFRLKALKMLLISISLLPSNYVVTYANQEKFRLWRSKIPPQGVFAHLQFRRSHFFSHPDSCPEPVVINSTQLIVFSLSTPYRGFFTIDARTHLLTLLRIERRNIIKTLDAAKNVFAIIYGV